MCRSYTMARRHPLMIGKIQGWRLPTMLSVTQLAVGTGAVVVLALTRTVWGQLVGSGPAQIFVIAVVPVALGWSVRHARMEGRSPLRMAFAVGVYAARRVVGPEVAGRSTRPRARRMVRGGRIFITSTLPLVSPVAVVLTDRPATRPVSGQARTTPPMPASGQWGAA